jgi:hypothetical protein
LFFKKLNIEKKMFNTETIFRDEESSDHSSDDEQVLEGPEPVLNSGPEIVGRSDVDHDDGHQ